MSFTLRQIEIFVEAAKDQNFRKTADRLGISQPAISKHIRLLEQRAGGQLFVRDRGATAKLAPLGETMLVEARAMISAARKVNTVAREAEKGEATLRIAAGNYLLDTWIRPQVSRIVTAESGLSLEFLPAADHDEMVRMLREGEADYVFYTGIPVEGKGIESRSLGIATIGLYASSALASTVAEIPGDLSRLPFILANKGTKSEIWQRTTLEQAGVVIGQVASRAQFMEVVINLVREGRGAALLFDGDAARYAERGEMVRLPIEFQPGLRVMVQRSGARRDARENRIVNAICALLQEGVSQHA